MMKSPFFRLTALVGTLLTAACAVQNTPTTTRHSNAPRWQELGFIRNNTISVSYDQSSIRRNGYTSTLRERKTLLAPQPEFSLNGLPHFKTAESVWQFHCAKHTYRLEQLTLLDENGNTVQTFHYPNDPKRTYDIPMGSLVEKQYKLACAAPV